LSLADVCSAEGRPISGFQHVDWQPADELAGRTRSGDARRWSKSIWPVTQRSSPARQGA
jgi:hypothetical protein